MKHDDKTRQLAFELFLDGKGYRVASKKLGLKEATVGDWFRRFRAGEEAYRSLLTNSQSRRCHSPELREKTIQLRLEGLSWTEIVRRTGVPKRTLMHWIDKTEGTVHDKNL